MLSQMSDLFFSMQLELMGTAAIKQKKKHHKTSPYDSCAVFQIFWSYPMIMTCKNQWHLSSQDKLEYVQMRLNVGLSSHKTIV